MAYTVKRIMLALLLLCVVFTAVAPTIQPAKAQTIQFWVDAYDFTANAQTSVEFFINDQSQGMTPQQIIADMSAYISAAHTDEYGNVLRGFAVNGYLYLGEYQPLTISNYEGSTITAYYEADPTPPDPTPTPTPEPTVPPTNDPTPTPPPITYVLAVQISGQGTVTPLGQTNSYPAGTLVEQVATPAAGWEFVRGELYDIDLNLIGTTTAQTNQLSMTENWITVYYFKEITATVAPTITPTIPPTITPPPTSPPTSAPTVTPTTNPNNPTPTPTPFVPPTYANYYIVGVNNETSGLKITTPIPVVSYYSNGHIPEVFWVDSSVNGGVYQYQTNSVPQNLIYILGDEVHREYWFRPDEASGTLYVTNASLTEYTINFLDQTGVLKKNYYIAAQAYVNGTLTTVEKHKIDAQNSVIMYLEKGQRYNILIEGLQQADFNYGEITMTAITGVQLIIRGVDFPKDTLLLYQYVHANAIRTHLTPKGDITISYGDTTGHTNSVTVTIQNATSSETVLTQTFSAQQTFSYSWHEADNETTYQITITVSHSDYGTFTFRQLLNAEGAEGNDAFSLDFLGVIGNNLDTAYLLPALLIILIAGCFSEVTAEAAAVISSILAVILAYMGWLPVPSAALIVALCFSLMAGIVAARKRMQYT